MYPNDYRSIDCIQNGWSQSALFVIIIMRHKLNKHSASLFITPQSAIWFNVAWVQNMEFVTMVTQTTVANFIKDVNSSLSELPLNFNGGLAKCYLISSVK